MASSLATRCTSSARGLNLRLPLPLTSISSAICKQEQISTGNFWRFVSTVRNLSAQPAVAETSQSPQSAHKEPQPSVSDTTKVFTSPDLIDLEREFSANNYHPLPVVFSSAKGTHVIDPEGRSYLDFLSAYSAVNQGHGHPEIVGALVEQLNRCALSSRAFHNDRFPVFAKALTDEFGFESVLPMNTGAEGVETAIKMARKWGYLKKGILRDEALVVSCCNCFHGRTLSAISMSCDNDATDDFWPLLKGVSERHVKVDFGDVQGLERVFKEYGPKIAGFIFEPIQGEAGVIVPPEGYLRSVRALCSKYDVLMISDEIQTGMGRTGRMLATQWELKGFNKGEAEDKPDIVILGKALGGGVMPVSAVLADYSVMDYITPGTHGSTFGGNPLASAVGLAALKVTKEEKLAERADVLGQRMRSLLTRVQEIHPSIVKEIRGKGLLNAVEINANALPDQVSAFDLCVAMKERGVLAKPTHDRIIRLSPPLTISDEEVELGVSAFLSVLDHDLDRLAVKNKSATALENASPSHAAKSPVCHRCGREQK